MALTVDQTSRHRMRVHGLLYSAVYLNSNARNMAVWRHIIESEVEAGTRFLRSREGSLYIYWGMSQEILPLTKGSERVHAYLNNVYGLSQTTPAGKFVASSLLDFGITNATEGELRRFVQFNTKTKTVYMNAYDGGMWKIDGGTPVKINNGDDSTFFVSDDGGIATDVDIAPHGILLDKLTNLNYAAVSFGGMSPEQQRMALTVWIFALAFPDLMPTKPLLILEGTQGSGKSAAVQLLQVALLGEAKPMILSKNKEDDFGVMLLRSPIAVFDNTDSYIEWVPDAICAYTTLGYWVKRKLFSDSDEVQIRPHAFIAVASKNPASFRREDTADRCIVLRLDRLTDFRPLQDIRSDIIELRSQLLGEYMWYVNRIVNHMRVYNDEMTVETTRMADFAAFARIVGEILGWKKEDVSDLMLALASERDAFINEEDPLVDLLHKWIVYRGGGYKNSGRELTLHELHNELDGFAKAHNITYYKQARTLAQKLRSPHIERDFEIETTVNKGRKLFRLWNKGEPRLKSVPRPPDPEDDDDDVLFVK
jgi:hypothetical protein